MKKKQRPLTNNAGEVRELTARDLARMRPAREVLPKIFGAKAARAMLRPAKHAAVSNTDWPRVKAMRDADIDLSDTPEVTAAAAARGITRIAGKKKSA
jgi:hypothetical protein